MFATEVLSFFTGFIYLSFIARNLSLIEYGVWRFVMGILIYFDFLQSILSFWVLRDSSRGLPVERTAIIGNLLLSVPFTIVFLLFAPQLSEIINYQPSLFYVACLMIPGTYIIQSLDVIIRAKFPHQMAYKNIVLDLLKIGSIFFLIQFGLIGVIWSIIIGLYGYVIFALYMIRNLLHEKFNLSKIRQWLSSSWVTLYGQIGKKTYQGIDVLTLGLLGSKNIGSYSVAETITSTITASRALTYALYPKLLRNEKDESSVTKTMMLLLTFLIPMTVGCIVLAPNLIDFFGSKYSGGVTVLEILVITEFINVLSAVDRQIALGTEDVDIKGTSINKLLRSNIFYLESLAYIAVAIVIPFLIFLVPEYDITGAAIAICASTIATSFLKMWRTKFTGLRAISKHRLLKFLIASSVMVLFIFIFYSKGTVNTMIIIAASIIVYFGSLAAIDGKTVALGKATINELRKLF